MRDDRVAQPLVRQAGQHRGLHRGHDLARFRADRELRRALTLSGERDSETGSSGGTHVAPSERWRSGWDHEFESPLLQRGVICEPDFGQLFETKTWLAAQPDGRFACLRVRGSDRHIGFSVQSACLSASRPISPTEVTAHQG